MQPHDITWPDGKAFAFTIFDDTDAATMENVPPVYDLLRDCGMRTTKSVWPLRGERPPAMGGITCEDPAYVDWLHALQADGFEIGYHLATYHSSDRDQAIAGIDRFRELFGAAPRTMANHVGCADAMYWGSRRFTGILRQLHRLVHRRRRTQYGGDDPDSAYFWGDVCQANVQYVRNFVFPDIDTLAACPWMPYHDPKRPYVNQWFASSEGAAVDAFNRCISEANQDRLAAAGGACIMYTHLAYGFYENGRLQPEFERLLRRLAALNGWFVPVGTLLDHLRTSRGHLHELADRERAALERRWLLAKIRGGTS
jgi:hypothetical protein